MTSLILMGSKRYSRAQVLPAFPMAPTPDFQAIPHSSMRRPDPQTHPKYCRSLPEACLSCGALNFPAAVECHRCGEGRPHAAERALLEEKAPLPVPCGVLEVAGQGVGTCWWPALEGTPMMFTRRGLGS